VTSAKKKCLKEAGKKPLNVLPLGLTAVVRTLWSESPRTANTKTTLIPLKTCVEVA
jgi:hypothetical protein